MLELKITIDGDIFHLPIENEAVCVTTNGIVKPNGHAVMGKGIALDANKKFGLSLRLGTYLNQYGNRAFNLGKYVNEANSQIFTIFSFPTKHDWKNNSDIELIKKSAKELMEMCDKFNITKCYLTPPGCSCGKLDYENTVKPFLSEILDDRFVVVIRE